MKLKTALSQTFVKEAMSKGLSKYFAAFDYFAKVLVALSVASGGISIASSATVIVAPVKIASASFNFKISLTTGILKQLLSTTWNKEKKHNKIVVLARSKLNCIEMLICKVLIDFEISHEDYTTNTNEEEKCRRLKGNIRMTENQRSDTVKYKLIEEGKKCVINEIIRKNNGNIYRKKYITRITSD